MAKLEIYLPDFIIVGANKSGTTSVANYLDQHPNVTMSAIKEPMYFVADPAKPHAGADDASLDRPYFSQSLSAYSDLFSRKIKENSLLGEASTAYLCNPAIAAPSIRKIVPDVKLIAILRDPTERALSAYKMAYGNGLEERTLSQIVNSVSKDWKILHRHGLKEYIRNGLYGQQIEIFLKYFKRESILFAKYDDLDKDPMSFMNKICDFLEIGDYEFDIEKKFNKSSDHTYEKIEMEKRDREKLKEFFATDIRKTQEFTGLDLGNWL